MFLLRWAFNFHRIGPVTIKLGVWGLLNCLCDSPPIMRASYSRYWYQFLRSRNRSWDDFWTIIRIKASDLISFEWSPMTLSILVHMFSLLVSLSENCVGSLSLWKVGYSPCIGFDDLLLLIRMIEGQCQPCLNSKKSETSYKNSTEQNRRTFLNFWRVAYQPRDSYIIANWYRTPSNKDLVLYLINHLLGILCISEAMFSACLCNLCIGRYER